MQHYISRGQSSLENIQSEKTNGYDQHKFWFRCSMNVWMSLKTKNNLANSTFSLLKSWFEAGISSQTCLMYFYWTANIRTVMFWHFLLLDDSILNVTNCPDKSQLLCIVLRTVYSSLISMKTDKKLLPAPFILSFLPPHLFAAVFLRSAAGFTHYFIIFI